MPKYSQVLLENEYAAAQIVDSIEKFGSDAIAEIGPGKGVLTKYLIKLFAEKLLLIEIDGRMIEFLKKSFSDKMPAVINSDFMNLNLAEIFIKKQKVVFIGNLPYHCSTAILEKVLLFDKFVGASFMFQKEVARRIVAEPGDSDYGYFSIFSGVLSLATVFMEVPKSDFNPVPKVDSSVVVFKKKKDAFFENDIDLKNFLSLVKASFSHRRKTILNSLSISTGKNKQSLADIFKRVQIESGARPQNLSIEDFKKLYAEFKKQKLNA